MALITVEPREPEAEAFIAGVLSHWPDGLTTGVRIEAPRVHSVQLASLLSDPRSADVLRTVDVAILVSQEGVRPAELYRLAAVLEDSLTPGVVLVDGPSPALAELNPSNLFVHPRQTTPELLAALLYGLVCRQPATRGMQNDLRIAQSLQSGTAAEIDRLHEELLLAAHVQREFLPPRLPDFDRLQTAVLYRPVGFVSGDIYNLVQLDEHHLGFFLADAMGHGLAAALMTLFIAGNLTLRHAARAGDVEPVRLVPPAKALERLNRSLLGTTTGPARMASAVCGTIDTRTLTLTIAAAGHPAPMLVTRGGIQMLDISGTLLGVLDGSEYEQHTIQLCEGESLILHSDGLTDSRGNAIEDTWLEPFRRRAAGIEGSGLDLADAMGESRLALDQRPGSLHQHDDITVVAISVGPVPTAPAA
ncbi:MAG: serine/threonine-protein phosphatase [Phycisphaerales bacterium]|nr:serine/threonine-protein phosphatase [Phycisphaerales bacterium]